MNLSNAIDLMLRNFSKHGLSDITSEKLETRLLSTFADEFRKDVASKLNRGSVFEMEFRPTQHMLTPKNRYVFDYRRAAIVEPACLAKYTALTFSLADELEKHRIPIAEQVIFSARFAPNGAEVFDANVTYGSWRERTKELADEDRCKYVVHCDIAAFYDRVNIHRIDSTLSSIGIDKTLVRHINELLLLWAKKDSYGIPVGNVASRILAEAALLDIDRMLTAENIKFTRYVDDYRLFAPNIVVAQRWLNKLNTRLLRDGLMLNTGKTKLIVAQKSGAEPLERQDHADGAEAVLKPITKLTGGYNRIARTFLMPASEKFEPFKKLALAAELAALKATDIIEFEGIQRLAIGCLVQQQFSFLVKLAEICGSYMYGLDYFVDLLLKNKGVIPPTQRDQIADYYQARVLQSEFYAFEWHEATVATLLSDDAYFRKAALLAIVKAPNKETVTYPSMIALEGLSGKLSRADYLTIRDWFDRCDDWEKRRMIHLSAALPPEEQRAWLRAIKSAVQRDILAVEYVEHLCSGKPPIA